MTVEEFRRTALEMPGVVEGAHMNHPDFRVEGKIFASLGSPDECWGMVKLTPEQQHSFIEVAPGMFQPCRGAWGRRGFTNIHLASAKKHILSAALDAAFKNLVLPKGSSAVRERQAKRLSNRPKKAHAAERRKRLITLVKSLPEAKAARGHGRHLSLEVRGKRFGWFLDDHHGDGRLALNLKATLGVNESLATKDPERFHVPKYLGHRGWIGVWLDFPSPDWNEIKRLLEDAYRLAAPKRRITKN